MIRELQALLAPAVPGCRMHLFGSRACGLALPGSDYDVVALTDSQDTTHHRVRLRRHVESRCEQAWGCASSGRVTGYYYAYWRTECMIRSSLISLEPVVPLHPTQLLIRPTLTCGCGARRALGRCARCCTRARTGCADSRRIRGMRWPPPTPSL